MAPERKVSKRVDKVLRVSELCVNFSWNQFYYYILIYLVSFQYLKGKVTKAYVILA